MHAPSKAANIPILDDPTELEKYDAFLLGIPTRYGNFSGTVESFLGYDRQAVDVWRVLWQAGRVVHLHWRAWAAGRSRRQLLL